VTASELAFLALGLLLGAAGGAALLVVLGSQSPRREIRVTVTRDALSRRSETLSHDAFVTSPAQPAMGGPGDRRWFDRGAAALGATAGFAHAPAHAWTPTMEPAAAAPEPPKVGPDRTIVPSARPGAGIAVGAVAEPRDRDVRAPAAHGSILERIVRGDHRALVHVVDRIAGEDGRQRREWELLIGGLVDALADSAVEESVLDFPMGTAFWDTFTVEQCRLIVAALRTKGYRYDGRSGWTDLHVPAYRDLTNAMADIGVEPRRVRAWPNQSEIAALFVGARPAPEELLAAAGPDYEASDMQALLGERVAELAPLWLAWDVILPFLLDDHPAADSRVDSNLTAGR
jgi:hypothetical protein